jgi:hypothetical protein
LKVTDNGDADMPSIEAPWFPIIYVRGYAGNDTEIEDTVAEPYMGFNLGSTKFRQLWNGSVRRYYFESPLVRLIKDFGYNDVYSGGQEMPIDLDVSPRSIFIYRYYDEQFFDDLTGQQSHLETVTGKSRTIEDFARGLGLLIERIRDRICKSDKDAISAFRVYLVGHSMGGLVCRCFLQNQLVSSAETKRVVDKVFTYATPHNGIEFKVIGNVPGFFTRNDADNFNRARMAEYLGFPNVPDDVSNLLGAFDVNRFFCLIGTNYQDYSVGAGWSRRLTGPMSDGLVRIGNASVFDQVDGQRKQECPRSFVHRSHSGHYGIVNSEEGYQNLIRFLFGDVKVDGVLVLSEITLPSEVDKAWKVGKKINASYHFESVVRVRGFDWELHRRTVREDSSIFRTFDELFPKDPGAAKRNPHLFSVFLSTKAKVKARRPSLGFAVDLGVLVPDYEIAGILWRDQHFEGSYLFRDTIIIEATPPSDEQGSFAIRYGMNSVTPNRTTKTVELQKVEDNRFMFEIPLSSGTRPGISGKLVLTAQAWE